MINNVTTERLGCRLRNGQQRKQIAQVSYVLLQHQPVDLRVSIHRNLRNANAFYEYFQEVQDTHMKTGVFSFQNGVVDCSNAVVRHTTTLKLRKTSGRQANIRQH